LAGIHYPSLSWPDGSGFLHFSLEKPGLSFIWISSGSFGCFNRHYPALADIHFS
jgi:hypothetical protein